MTTLEVIVQLFRLYGVWRTIAVILKLSRKRNKNYIYKHMHYKLWSTDISRIKRVAVSDTPMTL